MPSGRPDVIASAIYHIMQRNPTRILDVGSGYGKWGFLLREYLEVWQGRWEPAYWEKQIDAIEIFQPYTCLPWYPLLYNTIYCRPVEDNPHILSLYDLVLFADVLEHLDKAWGWRLLTYCKDWLVITPNYRSEQGEMFGNPYERHLSRWTVDDFENVQLIGGRWIMAWGKPNAS